MATNPSTSQQVSPVINVQNVQDIYLRTNMQNLYNYFSTQNQLLNFKFFDVSFSKAQANYTLAHGLGYIPQDVIVTKITGAGIAQFNYGLFDATNVNITTTAACRVRFFVGSYWNYSTSTASQKTDLAQYAASPNSAGAVTTTPTATTNAAWDANLNLFANNFNEGYQTTVTSTATLSLTAASPYQQYFTGSVAQTVILPLPSTLVKGQSYMFVNNSSQPMTVNSYASNLVLTQTANSTVIYTCILNSGTTVASWNSIYISTGSGTPATVPTGAIIAWAASTVPTGYVRCDGTSYNSVTTPTMAALYAVIGTTFGGSGATAFSVPNLGGIFIQGVGSTTIGSVGYSATLGSYLNDSFQNFTGSFNYDDNSGGLANLVGDGALFLQTGSAINRGNRGSGAGSVPYQIVFNPASTGARTSNLTKPASLGLYYLIKL